MAIHEFEAGAPFIDRSQHLVDQRIATEFLDRASVFSLFSVPDPTQTNVPIFLPNSPSGFRDLVGIRVSENLHRFDIEGQFGNATGIRAKNILGEACAKVKIDWRIIPEEYYALPRREPPPTRLNSQKSQRFAMFNGRFTFDKAGNTGFNGFGVGRTYPVVVDGQPRLRIAAVVEILTGFGKMKGCTGNVVVNGYIRPPNDLALGLVLRIVDPFAKFASKETLIPAVAGPDTQDTFILLKGEANPAQPVTFNYSNGQIIGSNLHERLRLVDSAFEISPSGRIRTRLVEGPEVGYLKTTTRFNPNSNSNPIPLHTKNGVFTLTDSSKRVIGTLDADIAEGRVFRSRENGVPMEFFRICGFGPVKGGSGQFLNAKGMLTMNSAISFEPLTMSMLYQLRIIDPLKRLRITFDRAWSRN